MGGRVLTEDDQLGVAFGVARGGAVRHRHTGWGDSCHARDNVLHGLDRHRLGPRGLRLQAQVRARLVDDIVMVSAEPAPLQVRVEWPDGRVSEEWESPPSQIAPLKTALLKIVREEGGTLVALNALRQAGVIEQTLAEETTELNQANADELIWKYAKYKAIAVALNPVAMLILFGGIGSDIVMFRALAMLYGFPMARFESSMFWKWLLPRSATFLLNAFVFRLVFGFGKIGVVIWSTFECFSGLSA